MEIDVQLLREKVQSQQLDIRFFPSEDQDVDVLTKSLSPLRFQSLHSHLLHAAIPHHLSNGCMLELH